LVVFFTYLLLDADDLAAGALLFLIGFFFGDLAAGLADFFGVATFLLLPFFFLLDSSS
jgi:hypothetical protein